MAKSNSSIWVSLGLNTDKFKKGIKGAKGSMNGLKSGLSSLSPISLGVAGAIAGVGLAVGNAVKTFKDFEKANSELKAVLSGTEEQMEALSDQAKTLGSISAFTASEVTALQTSLAKLGFDTTAIQNMTESTLAAAAALGSELGEQAALTGATLKSFGLESSEAARVNDVLAKSAASSALDFGKLSVALPIVGAVAKATGLTLERTTAILGTLTSNGLDASSSATALRNILIKLKQKGLTWNEAMGKINSSTDKTKTSFDLFGKTSVAAGVILAEQKTTLDGLTTSLNNADGAAQAMADTMLNNLSGDVNQAGAAWEGFVLSLEDGNGRIAKALRGIVQSFTQLLENFKNDDIGDSLGLERGLFQDFSKLDKTLISTANSAKSFGSKFAATAKTLVDFKTKVDELKRKQSELDTSTQEGAAKYKIYNNAIISVLKASKVFAQDQAKSKLALQGTTEQTDELTKSTNNLVKAREKLEPVDKVDIKPPKIDLPEDMPPTMVPITPTITPISDEEKQKLLDDMALLQAQAQAVGDAVGGAFSSMANNLVGSLGLAATGMEGFVSGMANTVTQLIAMMLSSSISQAIAGATASGTATGPAAVFTTPAFIATAVGGILGSFAAIPAFAKGVNNFGGGTALVGELGPELVNLPRGSDVIPNNKLGDMGGGGMGGKVVFEIQGSRLVGILQREMKVNKFS